MTKPGKTIRVERSTVTGISIAPQTGQLTIEGVDQSKEGQTLANHVLVFGEGQLALPPMVEKSVAALREFAQRRIDDE